MTQFLYANNARSQTLAAIPAGTPGDAIVVQLLDTHGSKYPEPGTGEAFRVRFVERVDADTVKMEIMECTVRVGDNLSLTRAVETVDGGVPQAFAFSAGAFVELVQTAGTIEALRDEITAGLAGIYDYVDGHQTVTPDTDADVTLADVDKGIVVLATGAWTGAHSLILPAETRRLWVVNKGDFDATVKLDGGTGVVVKAGRARPLACDGVEVYDPLTAYYSKEETYSAAQVDSLIAAIETAGTSFGGWTGGTVGSDEAGTYYTVAQGTDAESSFYALEEVPSSLAVELGIEASGAAASYTIYLDLYDDTDTLLTTKTVLDVVENNATPALVEVTRTLADMSSTNVPVAAVKAKLRVNVDVAATSIKLYKANVVTEPGFGWGSLIAGDGALIHRAEAEYSSVPSTYTKLLETRCAGAGSVQCQIQTYHRQDRVVYDPESDDYIEQVHTTTTKTAENINVAAGDLVQVYGLVETGGLQASYVRIYVNGIAVGAAQSGAGLSNSITRLDKRVILNIRAAGTAADGTF